MPISGRVEGALDSTTGTGPPSGSGHSPLDSLVFADTVLLLLQLIQKLLIDSVGWEGSGTKARRVSFEAFCLYVNFLIYVP